LDRQIVVILKRVSKASLAIHFEAPSSTTAILYLASICLPRFLLLNFTVSIILLHLLFSPSSFVSFAYTTSIMRTRNQEKVPSSQSSSQQTAGADKRPSRKRRASSSSDAPIPQSSQTTVSSSSQIKRRKRQDASYDHPEDLTILDEEESTTISTPAPASRHVHFTESTSQVQKTTSTHLTPHIRKTVTTERRQTISPSKFEALSTPPPKSRYLHHSQLRPPLLLFSAL
jgi:hypothetical protein